MNTKQATTQLEKKVWNALQTVIDPELHVDIVSMGLIYSVSIIGKKVTITMTLTTPGCPLAGQFDAMIRSALSSIAGLDVQHDVSITLTFDPPWVVDMMTDDAKSALGM